MRHELGDLVPDGPRDVAEARCVCKVLRRFEHSLRSPLHVLPHLLRLERGELSGEPVPVPSDPGGSGGPEKGVRLEGLRQLSELRVLSHGPAEESLPGVELVSLDLASLELLLQALDLRVHLSNLGEVCVAFAKRVDGALEGVQLLAKRVLVPHHRQLESLPAIVALLLYSLHPHFDLSGPRDGRPHLSEVAVGQRFGEFVQDGVVALNALDQHAELL
mmetsp:Transcript_19775/g.50210  ORF Transcript_19775/g.50210 Transcript_19775/m.50210 type:complete len:218 (-) Transcript_19775:2534-3187(-)